MPGIHRAKQTMDAVFAALQTAMGAGTVLLNRKVPLQNAGSAESGATEAIPPKVAVYTGAEEAAPYDVTPYVDAYLSFYVDIYGFTNSDTAYAAWPTYRTLVEEALCPPNDPSLGTVFILNIVPDGADAPILEDNGDTVVEVLRTRWKALYRRTRGAPAS